MDKEAYLSFYNEFGQFIKEGVYTDFDNRHEVCSPRDAGRRQPTHPANEITTRSRPSSGRLRPPLTSHLLALTSCRLHLASNLSPLTSDDRRVAA